jgi:hypothetical protein
MLLHVPQPFATAGGEPLNILHTHWYNVVKPEGQKKCRCCLDGSKRAAPPPGFAHLFRHMLPALTNLAGNSSSASWQLMTCLSPMATLQMRINSPCL